MNSKLFGATPSMSSGRTCGWVLSSFFLLERKRWGGEEAKEWKWIKASRLSPGLDPLTIMGKKDTHCPLVLEVVDCSGSATPSRACVSRHKTLLTSLRLLLIHREGPGQPCSGSLNVRVTASQRTEPMTLVFFSGMGIWDISVYLMCEHGCQGKACWCQEW